MTSVTVYSGISSRQTRIVLDLTELERLIAKSPERAKEVVKKVAFRVEARAKPLTALDTGALRASIYTVADGYDGYAAAAAAVSALNPGANTEPIPRPTNEFTAHVGPSVEYGIYQEFGTRFIPGKAYLTPAVFETESELPKAFSEIFDERS